MLSEEKAIELFDAELRPDQLGRCSETDCWYGVLKSELLSYTRKVEQAARAELLAGVGMEPAKSQYFICTKCGMHGAGGGSQHRRHDGTLCGYLAHSEGPYYTADQLAAAVVKAKAEQREADAKVCKRIALSLAEQGGQFDSQCDAAEACGVAIREGGEA